MFGMNREKNKGPLLISGASFVLTPSFHRTPFKYNASDDTRHTWFNFMQQEKGSSRY